MPAGLLKQRNSILEGISMSILKNCSFYLDAEDLTAGKNLEDCEYCNRQIICDSGNQFSDRQDGSGKQPLEQRKDGGWENKEKQDVQRKPFRYRILVVEDEEPMRRVIADLLSEHGHQCMTANNGIDALNQFNRNDFDAVITDIGMPEMDGIALTRELSSLYPDLPIMIMTGSGEKYLELANSAGAWEFIGKAFLH
jgi:CheY-like chemotaxis protein